MNETFRVLIDTFGKGWERGDVDAICSVFTEDAVFLETPFEGTHAFYRRLGFEHIAELRPVAGAPPVWTMTRPASS